MAGPEERKFIVIAGPGRTKGFRCAGFDTLEVSDKDDISRILSDIEAGDGYGVVAIEDGLFEKTAPNVMRKLRRSGIPLVVPLRIPSGWQEAKGVESPVIRLIRKAIGYQIRLKR